MKKLLIGALCVALLAVGVTIGTTVVVGYTLAKAVTQMTVTMTEKALELSK